MPKAIGGLGRFDVIQVTDALVLHVVDDIHAIGLGVRVLMTANDREVPQGARGEIHAGGIVDAAVFGRSVWEIANGLDHDGRIVAVPGLVVVRELGSVIQNATQPFVCIEHHDEARSVVGWVFRLPQLGELPTFVVFHEDGAGGVRDTACLIEGIVGGSVGTVAPYTDLVEGDFLTGNPLCRHSGSNAIQFAVPELVGEGVEVAGVPDPAASRVALCTGCTTDGLAVDARQACRSNVAIDDQATRPLAQGASLEHAHVGVRILVNGVWVNLLSVHLVDKSASIVRDEDRLQSVQGKDIVGDGLRPVTRYVGG